MKKLLARIKKMLRDRRTRQLLTRIVSITAAVVVFITTYALVLPAITMESEANCGIPAHQHDDSCYEDRLICGQVESPGHHHTDACYSISKSLICTETEHRHDDSCFDADGNLICGLAEHTHNDSCYEEVRELTCSIPESDGHVHTADCYERVLICGMEAHTHSPACYSHASGNTASATAESAAVATTESGSYAVTVSDSASAFTGDNSSASTDTATGDYSSASTSDTDTATSTTSDIATAEGTASNTAAAASTAYNTATAASTKFDATAAENAFIPQLEPVIFEKLLTKDTGIYYFHAEENEKIPENSADITDWKRVNDDTELAPADLLRVYLRYTIPAGTINPTNDIARYRLPSNLHLTDQQMEAINTTVNGIASQYVSLDTLEITDTEKYNTYLGIEATEGTRKPSDDINHYFADHPELEGQEYINAVVRAENVFDDTTGEYIGQDLIFTFSPYTVQKNQHEYDTDGQPTKAGQKVDGWLCFDLHMDQIDWSEPVVSTTEDSAASIQDQSLDNTEDTATTDTTDTANATDAIDTTGSTDPADATYTIGTADTSDTSDTSYTATDMEGSASEADGSALRSSSDPEASNTNTIAITEKKESSAKIVFAAKDKTLKIDEISTELHLVELNTVETDNTDTQDEHDHYADDSADSTKPESELIAADDDATDDSNPEEGKNKPESTDSVETDSAVSDAEDQSESAMEINAETYPAVSFENTITVKAGTLSTDNETAAQDTPAETAITVSVIAEPETFPLGTTMQLSPVEDMDTVASAVEGAVEGRTRGFHAVDISFHNADGEEIEPLKPIKVSMTSDAIKQAVEDSSTAPVVVHVGNPKDSTTADAASDSHDDVPANKVNTPSQTETTTSTPVATIVEITETLNTDNTAEMKETADTLSFDAGAFSVYAIVYTVDFHWEVDGKEYSYSITGGSAITLSELLPLIGVVEDDENTEINETTAFLNDVSTVTFSDPDLVDVSKAEEDTTVGKIKDNRRLKIQYSDELTEAQITEINNSTVSAGDWALISLQPFTGEESLTVTMKNGESFVIKVTDAAIEKENLVSDSGYIIYATVDTADGPKYCVLKTNGTTEMFDSTVEMDHLSNEYKWKFTYVYSEKGIERYNIRPYNDKSISLSLNYPDKVLVENGPNNITIVPANGANADDGYKFGGFHNTLLKLNQSQVGDNIKYEFAGVDDSWDEVSGNDYTPVFIYNLEELHTYEFTVLTDDSDMGKVSGKDKDGQSQTNQPFFTAVTNYYTDTTVDKANKDEITAVADTSIIGADNTGSKYVFDHWELDGKTLYKDNRNNITTDINQAATTWSSGKQIPVMFGNKIGAGKLVIPSNGSILKAIFAESKTYKPKDNDKQGTDFGEMSSWLRELQSQNTPIKPDGCKKTAEVYDYENRIYRVDLTAQSAMKTFDGDIDLGFILDVSKSMEFPSRLNDINEGVSYDVLNINSTDNSKSNGQYYNYSTNRYENRKPYYWETWNLNPDVTYYIISDKNKTATVCELKFNKSSNKWQWRDASAATSTRANVTTNTTFKNETSSSGNTYPIYTSPNNRTRLMDLQDSMTATVTTMKKLLHLLSVVDETKAIEDTATENASDPDVRIAWMTFNKKAPAISNSNDLSSYVTSERNSNNKVIFNPAGNYTITTNYTTGGGTNTLEAIQWTADNFVWDESTRYAVLITDGAPQGGKDNDTGRTVEEDSDVIISKTATAFEGKGIELITVGLGIDDVPKGRKLLYDLADDVGGEHAFYSATAGDQLDDILLHILKTIMIKATVIGDVTDSIGEAFYPVDLNTGAPLKVGDDIDINGNRVPNSMNTEAAGRIYMEDGVYKVKWEHQDIPYDTGWHGTVYVKAKEDFLGGNAVVTNNDKAEKATVVATGYRTNDKVNAIEYPLHQSAYYLDDSNQVKENTNYKVSASMDTPRVNVNELNFLQNNTEWTVYLGTEVDPLSQLKALYNSAEVEEVIQKGAAGEDVLPSQLVEGKTKDDYCYPLTESISDKREPKTGHTETFLIKDLIESLVDKTGGYTSTDWWDYSKNDIRWDELIRLANLAEQDETTANDPEDPEDPVGSQETNTGLIIPYHPYGIQDGGYIRIMLTQETEGAELDYSGNQIPAHATSVTGDGVEKYSLTVFYTPDYSTVPVGQGGDPSTAKAFRTGGFGTAYQGHAAGTEESINDHEINVYTKGLDVLKLDEMNQPLPGAEFTLYRLAGPDESGSTLADEYELKGEYVVVGTGISGDDGIAEIRKESELIQLAQGETYYLVETKVPDGYQRDTAHRIVAVQAKDDGVFTNLDDELLNEKEYPFNWVQGIKILVDGEAAQTVNGELSQDGYAQLTEQVLFRARILNDMKATELHVTKNWKNKTGASTAENGYTISFQVTRQIGEDGTPEVIQLTDKNLSVGNGVSRNGNTVTLTYNEGWPAVDILKLPFYAAGSTTQKYIYNIVETAHTPQNKEVNVSYDRKVNDEQHISITIENTDKEEPVEIDVTKKWLDPDGGDLDNPEVSEIEFTLYRVHYVPCEHDWVVDELAPTCTDPGHYIRECSKCHEKEETILNATGHVWGEWEIIDPATYNHTGTKQRVCQNDASHIETQTYNIEDHAHIPGEWVTTTQADCEHDGVETQYCTICLEPLQTRVVPATDHKWVFDHADAATCHSTGTAYYICQNDQAHTKTEVIPKLEHVWGDTWTRTKEPTTEEEGEERRYCLRDCGEYQSRPIPRLPSSARVTIYEDKQNNGNYYILGDPDVREVTIGSTMHIEFSGFPCYSYSYHPNITYRLNSTATYSNDMQCYELQGVETPMNFESDLMDPRLIWGRYSMNVVITGDTRIDICIPNSWYVPILPILSISVTEPEETSGVTMNLQAPQMKRMAVRGAAASARLLASSAESTIPDVLQGIEGTVIPAADADGRDNVYVYEVVGTYQIEQPGWTWSKDDLPRSDEKGRVYTYYVSETTSLPGYEVTYSGQTDGLQDGATVEIRNKALKGAIQITKLVTYNGNVVPSDKAEYVNKNYTFSITKEGETAPVKTVTIGISNGESESLLIGNLDEGNYVIRETNSSGLTLKTVAGGISHNDTAKTVTVHVTAGKTSQANLEDGATASFTNNFTEYEIEIVKVDTESSTKKLGDAYFNLYKAEDVNIRTLTVIDGRTPINNQPIVSSSEESTKGEASLGDLLTGTYYLFETKAPDGYNLLDTPIIVTVSDGHVSLIQGTHEQTKDSSREGEIINGKVVFNITNTAGAELPSTGGHGTTLFYLLGLLLTALAGSGLALQKHWKKAA